eukprot:g4473.t1
MSAYRFCKPAPMPTPVRASGAARKTKKVRKAKKPEVIKAFDDDGEANGGRRLLGMMNKEQALDAVIVVSRWFGGTLLGKARFEHIMGAGRALLRAVGQERGRQWRATVSFNIGTLRRAQPYHSIGTLARASNNACASSALATTAGVDLRDVHAA